MSLLHREMHLTDNDGHAKVYLPNGDRLLISNDGVVSLLPAGCNRPVNTVNLYYPITEDS